VTALSDASAGDDGVFENLALKYKTIKIASRKRDGKGNLTAWVEVGWDLETGKL
jgi:hypothetical protein